MRAPIVAIIFTLLAAAAVYLAGNSRVQLWDRDEPRYAQCSRQMLQSGDWVVPRLYDRLRFQKPPLIYWCQASAMKLFGSEGGEGAFSARLPSVVAMLLTLTILAIAISKSAGPQQAAWTIFVLATSVMTLMAAKTCLTDSVLLLFIVVAQLCLYAIWRGKESAVAAYRWWSGNFWLWLVVVLLGVVFGFLSVVASSLLLAIKFGLLLGVVFSLSLLIVFGLLLGVLFGRASLPKIVFGIILTIAFGLLIGVTLGLGILCKGPFILGTIASTAAGLSVFRIVEKIIRKRDLAPNERPAVAAHPVDMAVTGEIDSSEDSLSPSHRHPDYGRARCTLALAVAVAVGIVVALAIVIPWLLFVHVRAPDFLPAMLHEGKQHALEGKEGHHFPPGYHLLMVWPMFMPWSLLLPMGIGVGIRHRKVPQVRFALAAALGPWMMVEFMGTKLPHYLLPAYPALAFLVAFAICECLRLTKSRGQAADPDGLYPRRGECSAAPDQSESPVRHDLASKPFLIATAFWALVIAIIGALPWVFAGSFHFGKYQFDMNFRPLPWNAMIALSALGVVYAAGVFLMIYRRKFVMAFASMGVGMFATVSLAYIFYFPNADFLRISTHVAGVLQRVGATHPGDVEMLDYKEPSLGFYQGGTIRETEITVGQHHWPHWVVMTRQNWDTLPDSWHVQFRIIDSYRGFAYSDRGRVIDVIVIENSVY